MVCELVCEVVWFRVWASNCVGICFRSGDVSIAVRVASTLLCKACNVEWNWSASGPDPDLMHAPVPGYKISKLLRTTIQLDTFARSITHLLRRSTPTHHISEGVVKMLLSIV